MIRDVLSGEINKAIKILYPNIVYRMTVVRTSNSEFGDYSFAAMDLTSRVGQNPRQIAEEIRKKLMDSGNFNKYVAKTEIAGPGFLNFWLSDESLIKELVDSTKNSGRSFLLNRGKKEKISLDYLDANPTGPVHLGHARSGFYGDALSNILEFYGHKISREFYVNNAKSSKQIQSLGKTALSVVEGGQGEEYKHEQLLEILKKPEVQKKLKKMEDPKEAGFYIAGLIQKENESFLKKIAKIKFDIFFAEEKVYSSSKVKEIIEKLKKASVAYEKDGALWFKSAQYGDTEDRVLIRSTGEPTYFVPDIYYHLDRLIKRKNDKIINIFGADHYGAIARVKGALAALGIDTEKIVYLLVQMVRLIKGGEELKMQKRKDVFVTLEELIKDVGLDVVRFFFLMRSLDTHMDFDLDLAKERSKKNPVYYAQYAHARACSILRKGSIRHQVNFEFLIPKIFASRKFCAPTPRIQNLSGGFERNLILKLIQFPEIIEDIVEDYQVHRLTTYVYELAKIFTDFYENAPVLKAETKELKKSRLALVMITKKILNQALNLMGISAPEKM